jgi:hypothetical protein
MADCQINRTSSGLVDGGIDREILLSSKPTQNTDTKQCRSVRFMVTLTFNPDPLAGITAEFMKKEY